MATIEQRLRFILDGDAQATRGLKNISRAVEDVGAETRQAANTPEMLANAYEDASRRSVAALSDIQRQQNRLAQDRFDEVSRDVGLAGDVQSNLGAISGLAGAAGAQGLASGIGTAGELFALTEELPRLKAALAGMKSTVVASLTALGPAGVAVGLVAAGAAAIAFAYKQSIKEQEEALKNFAAASADFVDFAAGGGTAEGAQQQIEQDQRRISALRSEIQRLQEEYDANNFGVIGQIFNGGEQALADQISEFEAEIEAAEARIERFGEAVNEGTLPVEGASKAFEKAAKEVQQQAPQVQRLTQARDAEAKAIQRTVEAVGQATQAFEKVEPTFKASTDSFFKRRTKERDAVASAERDIANDRINIIKQFNAEEQRIREQAAFDQLQNLERYEFERGELLRRGSFQAAFDLQRRTAFQQGQNRSQLAFDASQRRADLQSNLQQVAIEIRPSEGFDAQVRSSSARVTSRVIRIA